MALTASNATSRLRVLRWALGLPAEEERVTSFYEDDKYFARSAKAPEIPERWKNTPGPWDKVRR